MEQTCSHCGYQRTFCQCGRKRNPDGNIRKPMWRDYKSDPEDYSRTASIRSRQDAQQKWNHDRLPVSSEQLITYIQRSDISIKELVEYSMHRHLYGTSKTWPCHTQARHCLVCDLCQEVTTLRQLLKAIAKEQDIYHHRIYLEEVIADDGDTQRVEVSLKPPVIIDTEEDKQHTKNS